PALAGTGQGERHPAAAARCHGPPHRGAAGRVDAADREVPAAAWPPREVAALGRAGAGRPRGPWLAPLVPLAPLTGVTTPSLALDAQFHRRGVAHPLALGDKHNETGLVGDGCLKIDLLLVFLPGEGLRRLPPALYLLAGGFLVLFGDHP